MTVFLFNSFPLTSTDASHGCVSVSGAGALISVTEALAPRGPPRVLQGGPVPAVVVAAAFVKSADRGAVVEENVEFVLGWDAPIVMIVRVLLVQGTRVVLRAIEGHCE